MTSGVEMLINYQNISTDDVNPRIDKQEKCEQVKYESSYRLSLQRDDDEIGVELGRNGSEILIYYSVIFFILFYKLKPSVASIACVFSPSSICHSD